MRGVRIHLQKGTNAIISIEELKQAVVCGRVGAISIDTSFVERYQYGFESGVLAKMSQFRRTNTIHL